jgi:hypothetical protein
MEDAPEPTPDTPDHGPDWTPQANNGMRTAWLRSRPAGILAFVVTAGVLAGAGVAFAATSSPSQPSASGGVVAATPSPKPSKPGGFGHHFRGGPGFGFGFGGGMFGAVHGQFVVAKPGGGYQTVDVQRGSVTAVSSTSITVKSPDGYSHSYAVTSSTVVDAQRDGIGSVKTGNQVSVTATVSGSTATAASIADMTLMQNGAHHFFGAPPPGSSPKS